MQHLRTLLTIVLLISLQTALTACSSGSSGSSGSIATQEINTEFWSGSARLQHCDDDVDMIGMFPGIQFVDGKAFVAAKATLERTKNFDSSGVLTSETLSIKTIRYDGAVFFDLTDSDPTNDSFAPTALTTVNPPVSGNLLHLEFPNVDEVTVGPPDTFGDYPKTPVVEGGGLVINNDGPRQYAFLFIHDKWGCDLVIAAIQKAQLGETGDEPLPVYDVADFNNTVWNGTSEEFRDDSASSNPPDSFPIKLTWVDEPSWELNFNASAMVTAGSSGSFDGNPVSITGGSIILEDPHGYYTGTLSSDFGSWVIRGFLTPDKKYFGGFAWIEPWTDFWHDLSLVKR